jgi:anti-sigma factor RsiW
MNCGEVKEFVQLYMDNELDARATLDVRRHLDGCPACSAMLRAFESQDLMLREAAREKAPDGGSLRVRILDEIRNQPSRAPERRRPSPLWSRAAAAVIIAAAALLLLFWGTGPGINEKAYAAAASDHAAHCTLENLATSVSNAGEIDRLVALYGHLKRTPDFSLLGFVEPRAKVCSLDGVPVLHLVFQNTEQQPLSVFLKPATPDFIEGSLRVAHQGGYSIASASQSGIDLLVVSRLSREESAVIAGMLLSEL